MTKDKIAHNMRKVGIITYHHYHNYGTALQAYALQRAISDIDGYRAELIDFRTHEEKRKSALQLLLLRIRRLPAYVIEWQRVRALQKYGSVLAQKRKAFDLFFSEDFVQSATTYHTFKELKQSAPEYDVMVTGSDQTWSPKIGFHPAMFLEFGTDKPLRIAYAPSIGVSHLTKRESEYMNVHLQPFEAISCRERLGTEVLNSVVKNKSITNVLDPTLLLTKEDWDKIAVAPQIAGDYILCYFIGHKTYYREIAQQLSRDTGWPLYFIPVSWQDMGKGYRLLPEAGPREFLGLIGNARLVLTDSFHGTAFSINYRKSFYSFTKIEGGKSASDNSRLYDILSKLRLENRLFDMPTRICFTDVDYSEAEKILQSEREKSLAYLTDALTDRRICPHVACTGCMACESACHHDAIRINHDLMGFHYPVKDVDKCVACGLCEKVCPNNAPLPFRSAQEAFVAAAVETEEQSTSTSGGLASVMARYVIRHGGVVYGCTSDDAPHIRHIRIDTEKDIRLLKGSKYVQSDMQGIVAAVKTDLSRGTTVLFIGTPCQVAGLSSALRKPYANLFTADFVCHGVPSQEIFNRLMNAEYPAFASKPLSVQFRRKDAKGSSYGVYLTDGDKHICHEETFPDSRYAAGFLGGMYYRQSCYQCHYARLERVSDITLGDYWDRERRYVQLANHDGGLSMILVNTEKGKSLMTSIGENITSSPITPEELASHNGQLRRPMKRHAGYVRFQSEYMNNGYTAQAAALLDAEIRRVHRSKKLTALSNKVKSFALGRLAVNMIKKMKSRKITEPMNNNTQIVGGVKPV